MGDTPINLSSPEQMSWVIYSRKPRDKVMWANAFTPYMPDKDYKKTIKANSDIMYKTKAQRCQTCLGAGKIRKVRKNGIPYANDNICTDCKGNGYHFKPTSSIAGLKFTPPNAKWVSANGFTVNKTNLVILQNIAKKNNLTNALEHQVRALNFSLDELVFASVGKIKDNIFPALVKKSFFLPLKFILVFGSFIVNSNPLNDFFSNFGYSILNI